MSSSTTDAKRRPSLSIVTQPTKTVAQSPHERPTESSERFVLEFLRYLLPVK